MPVESTLSTKELRKTWTGKSSRARAFSRKPKKARADPKIRAPKVAPPQVDTVVTLFFKARYCCVPDAKPHLNCSHPAKVLSVSADNFKAQCSDKSVWDIEIQFLPLHHAGYSYFGKKSDPTLIACEQPGWL